MFANDGTALHTVVEKIISPWIHVFDLMKSRIAEDNGGNGCLPLERKTMLRLAPASAYAKINGLNLWHHCHERLHQSRCGLGKGEAVDMSKGSLAHSLELNWILEGDFEA